MMQDDKAIGILAIDTQESGLGILTGDRWETVDSLLLLGSQENMVEVASCQKI